MPGPVKNFTQPTGLSFLLTNPMPIPDVTIKLDAFRYMRRQMYTFFKFGLVKQGGTIHSIAPAPNFTTLLRLPMPPLIRQVLVTFPPIYKTRSGRQRPLKGQLWPRTR